jgi:formate/nitrite transporter FocA (FNT family)
VEEVHPGTPAVPLDRRERRVARARSAPGPHVVHEAIRREGDEELARPAAALGWSGLAAGLSMGFSLVAEGVLSAGLPDAPWAPLVAKLGYSLGFVFVVLGRQQLFTETTLVAVLPVLAAPSRGGLARAARVWAVVLAANLAGAGLFAWALTTPGLFSAEHQAAFVEIGERAAAPAALARFVRGVFGGWLIALMVWLLPAAVSARFFVIVAVTWLVGAAELSHSIAGSVEVLHLVARGELGLGGYLAWLGPVLLGNSVGGVTLVAALNHAQVVAGNGKG